jgi:hypothetical protein
MPSTDAQGPVVQCAASELVSEASSREMDPSNIESVIRDH